MGQYFQIFNTDKMQKLNPQMFGDGMKFLEFGPNSSKVYWVNYHRKKWIHYLRSLFYLG